MIHLKSVEALAERRSRWTGAAPGGLTVEWLAETLEDRPGELISWRSLEGSDVANAGTVRFTDAPGDRGTEVHLEMHHEAPLRTPGALVAKLGGEEPTQQVKDDLRRFKQLLETGEVVVSEGSPEASGPFDNCGSDRRSRQLPRAEGDRDEGGLLDGKDDCRGQRGTRPEDPEFA